MLRDIFTNKWILGGFALLIIIAAGCYVFYQVSTAPYKIEAAEALEETDEFIQWWKKRNATPKNISSEVPMSDDGKQVDVGMSDKTSDEVQVTDNTPDFWSLSPEVRQQIFDQFYLQRGLKRPPPGYVYRWKDIGVPLLDENGNPVLHKRGEPYVDIQMRVGFAPTREEYERYKQLQEDQGWAEARGDFTEADRLAAEIDALEAAVQRVRPVHVITTWVGAEAKAKAAQVSKEKLNAALREHGLEHLISSY